MPTGIIIDSLAIVIGGLLGGALKSHISESFRSQLNLILGLASMGMGISSIVLMDNMPAVIFALILGTGIGLVLKLESGINKAAASIQRIITRDSTDSSLMVTAVVLFCASGTGIYGSLISGMSGDHSILIAKAVLDFFTAMIFACSLGWCTSLIAIPQFIIFYFLFLLADVIVPLTTPEMIADFKACGGFIMLATGFRMTNLKMFPIADMIPAMLLILPFSWIWSTLILPLL